MPIIGTAGHIDHGKTALVHALTGQDTDRLQEEKARGISIDLGFAVLDGPGQHRAGIVDVPGHERFIRNMLAGAHGMDLVLLTVAADDGVMPQTEEHLDILHVLGVRRGIVVVTKADLVDTARLAGVREEVAILTLGTTLESAPVVVVSAKTGAGLDALRAEIATQLAMPAPPARVGRFRMPIDRVFVLHGQGVVVTGTVIAGRVREGETLRVLPGGGTVRVRSLEVHGRAAAAAGAGERVALSLVGIERGDVTRGHVVCDAALARVTRRLDAWVELRPSARRPVPSHGRVRLHVGTAEVLAKLVLGSTAALEPGQQGWAQLVLRTPVATLRGDRFVLRDETARRTLGGGEVVHAFAERHRRAESALGERLTALRSADLATAARAVLELAPDFASDVATVAEALNVPDGDAQAALAAVPEALGLPDGNPEVYTITARWDRLAEAARAAVRRTHRVAPLAPGLEMESLRTGLPWGLPPRVFRWCVDRLVAAGMLAREDSALRLPGHRAKPDDRLAAAADRVERLVEEGGLTPPDLRQLVAATALGEPGIAEALRLLESQGRVVRAAAGLYWSRDAAERAKALVTTHCRTHGTITAAAFRDLIGGSRKFAIAFLDWCDRTGVTIRVGDVRKLRRTRATSGA